MNISNIVRKHVRKAKPNPLNMVPPRYRKPNPRADWSVFIQANERAWNDARMRARKGPLILIPTSTGGHDAMTPLESLLAVALTLRGARVHFLLCDGLLPACMQAITKMYPNTQQFIDGKMWGHQCPRCFGTGYATYMPFGLPIHLYSQYVSSSKRATARKLASKIPACEIPTYRTNQLAIGEHALAGALRYFAKGDLEDEPFGEAVLRRYFEAALLTTFAMDALLTKHPYQIAVFHHGIYVPQGIVGQVARAHKVRVVNWSTAYRKQCYIFSHNDTFHHTLRDEPTSEWETMCWNTDLQAQVQDYLDSRWEGSRDWISFHEHPELSVDAIAHEIGIDFSKPTIGLLTNVVWDAQLHYPANAFPNMLEWLMATIRYFAQHPDVQLLIRVHPAELRGTVPSRQPVVAEIAKVFPELPSNVFIIPPESNVSTYAAMLQCDSVIIYGTKTGVELASYGLPVVVAGEAWIRNKGLTRDASSPSAYRSLLDELPVRQKLDEDTRERALKYAYHFFFRRMIPLHMMEPTGTFPPAQLKLQSLEELQIGSDKGLDIICQGILDGTSFIYPAETLRNKG